MLSRQAFRRLARPQATASLPLPPSARRTALVATSALRAILQARGYATAQPPSSNDPFANGTNAYYVEEMYRYWRDDPKSVHASWDVYFKGMENGLTSPQAFQPPPSILPNPSDGSTTLHGLNGGNGDLDIHLKVCDFSWLFKSFFEC